MSALDFLQQETGLARGILKQAMDKGALWLNRGKQTRRLRRAKSTVNCGDTLHMYFNPQVLAQTVTPPQLILDHQHYSLWYKPYGVYSQGSKWGDHCSITRLVEKTLQRPAFLVHRLDRAAQGLMILAHNKSIARYFSEQFKQRQVTKIYRAVCTGHLTIRPYSIVVNSPIDGKEALSHIKAIAHGENTSLLQVTIETGRKHQIRRHLAELGYPILGDRLHGNAEDSCDLQLSSHQIGFSCPLTNNYLEMTLPDTLQLTVADT